MFLHRTWMPVPNWLRAATWPARRPGDPSGRDRWSIPLLRGSARGTPRRSVWRQCSAQSMGFRAKSRTSSTSATGATPPPACLATACTARPSRACGRPPSSCAASTRWSSTCRTSAAATTRSRRRCSSAWRRRRRHGLLTVVLDRPNPLGGDVVEGPALQPGFESFVGAAPDRHPARPDDRRAGPALPRRARPDRRAGRHPLRGLAARHGLRRRPVCRGCCRRRTCRPSRRPSSTPGSACSRGRTCPKGAARRGRSSCAGAPWIEPRRLAERLRRRASCPASRSGRRGSGRRSRSSPARSCGGVQLHVTDRDAFRPVRTGLAVLAALRDAVRRALRLADASRTSSSPTARPSTCCSAATASGSALEAGEPRGSDRRARGRRRKRRSGAAAKRILLYCEQNQPAARPWPVLIADGWSTRFSHASIARRRSTWPSSSSTPRHDPARRSGSRAGSATCSTYFVGDRNVAWWLVLVSIVATETSTVTFLSVPGLAFNRERRQPHLPATRVRLHHRPVLDRLVAAAAVPARRAVLRLPGAAAALRPGGAAGGVGALPGHAHRRRRPAALPDRPCCCSSSRAGTSTVSILVMGVATIVYTYLGGMKAVIWTDLIQFVI